MNNFIVSFGEKFLSFHNLFHINLKSLSNSFKILDLYLLYENVNFIKFLIIILIGY